MQLLDFSMIVDDVSDLLGVIPCGEYGTDAMFPSEGDALAFIDLLSGKLQMRYVPKFPEPCHDHFGYWFVSLSYFDWE